MSMTLFMEEVNAICYNLAKKRRINPMMNLMLDDETERYLIEILAVEKIPSDRLIKKILRDRWLTHQPKKTILERMGGEPEHLLEGPGNLSNREVRKKAISEYVEQHHQRR